MEDPDDRLHLLLADADERRPVLEDGLPGDAAQHGPKPKKSVRGDDSPFWRRTDADPNDLPAQRWAVIAPEGREGDRQLEAIAPLLRLREEEQGAPAKVYRVPPEMDTRQAVRWKDDVYWAEDVLEEERPLYLLMLGDLHQTSGELQHSLAHGALVGRVHFADEEGKTDAAAYAAYADKVVRFAREATPDTAPDLLFFVARDGTRATRAGEAKLVRPGLAAAHEGRDAGRLPAASVREVEARTVDELLSAGAGARTSVLLSVSHGLGAPESGWRSEREQRRRQGALVLGRDEILDAERLGGQPFLPGGMWFLLACFGAGTPATSAYHAWISQLEREGVYGGSVEAVLRSLPAAGQRPFVAALPQAALAHPAGPLAVLGHLDLAWTYSFSSMTKASESRRSRLLSSLGVMVRGSRAGVALEAILRFYRETNDALMSSYELEADARAAGRSDPRGRIEGDGERRSPTHEGDGERRSPTHEGDGERRSPTRVERAHLWMLRNDLRGYVLLGDPAARLPLRQNALGPRETALAPAEVRP